MLVFGKGCYDRERFAADHPDLEDDDIDLAATTLNDKLLKSLQLIVDNTYKNVGKSNIEVSPNCTVAVGQFKIEIMAVLLAANSDSTTRVTISDGVHQQESAKKDKAKYQHFTASVAGQTGSWHFYMRTNGKRLYKVSATRENWVKFIR
jgi:hypothetical protein